RARGSAGCHPGLAALPVAGAGDAAWRWAGVHRPEAGVVPAAPARRRVAGAPGPDRYAGVRPLALGGFLVPGRACGDLQAWRVRARAAPPGAAGARQWRRDPADVGCGPEGMAAGQQRWPRAPAQAFPRCPRAAFDGVTAPTRMLMVLN